MRVAAIPDVDGAIVVVASAPRVPDSGLMQFVATLVQGGPVGAADGDMTEGLAERLQHKAAKLLARGVRDLWSLRNIWDAISVADFAVEHLPLEEVLGYPPGRGQSVEAHGSSYGS